MPNADRNSARAHEYRFCVVNVAQAAFFERVLRRAHRRGETKLPAKIVNQFSSRRFFPQHFHFRRIPRRRLFAKHMLPSFERGERSREMQKVRQTNDRRVHTLILQEFFIADVAFLRRVFLFELGSTRLIKVGAGVEICLTNCAQGQRVLLARPTRPDDPKIQFFHVEVVVATALTAWRENLPQLGRATGAWLQVHLHSPFL